MIQENNDNIPISYTINDVPAEVNVFSIEPEGKQNSVPLPLLDTSNVNIRVDWNNDPTVWNHVREYTDDYITITKNNDNNSNKFLYTKTNILNENVEINEKNRDRYMDPRRVMYSCSYREPSQIIALLNEMPIKNLMKRDENGKTYIYLSGYTVKDFIKTVFGIEAAEFETKQNLQSKNGQNYMFSNVSTVTLYIKTGTHTIRIQRDGCSALEGFNIESALIGTQTNSLRYLMPSFGELFEPSNESLDLLKTFHEFGIERFGVENKMFLVRPQKQRITLLGLDAPPGILSVVSFLDRNNPYFKKKTLFALCRYIFGVFGYTWKINEIKLMSQNPIIYEVTLTLYVYNEDGTVRKYRKNSIESSPIKKNDIVLKKTFISTLKKALQEAGNIFVPPKVINKVVKDKFLVYKKVIETPYFKPINKEEGKEKEKRLNDDQNNVRYEIKSRALSPESLNSSNIQPQRPMSFEEIQREQENILSSLSSSKNSLQDDLNKKRKLDTVNLNQPLSLKPVKQPNVILQKPNNNITKNQPMNNNRLMFKHQPKNNQIIQQPVPFKQIGVQNRGQNPPQNPPQNPQQNPLQNPPQNRGQNPPQNPPQNRGQNPPQNPPQNRGQNPPQN